MTSGTGRKVQKRDDKGVRIQAYSKGKYEQMDGSELNAALDLVLDSMQKFETETAHYENNDDGFEKFKKETYNFFNYIREVNNDPESDHRLIPDIEGWAIYIGINRNLLWRFAKRGKKWEDFIERGRESIALIKKQLAFGNKIPSVFAMFDMVNNHGYVNTNEFHITNKIETEKPQLTAEQLIERSRQLPGFSEETSLLDEKRIPNDIFDREIIDGDFVTIEKEEEKGEDNELHK